MKYCRKCIDRVTERESLFSLHSDHEKKVIPPVDKPSDEGAVEVSNIPASTVAPSTESNGAPIVSKDPDNRDN